MSIQLYENVEDLLGRIGPEEKVVVVFSDKGVFIHGKPIKPINPHQERRLTLFQAGARSLFGEENVRVLGGS